MNPLVTWKAKNPRSQRTKRTTKIVQSIAASSSPAVSPGQARVLASVCARIAPTGPRFHLSREIRGFEQETTRRSQVRSETSPRPERRNRA